MSAVFRSDVYETCFDGTKGDVFVRVARRKPDGMPPVATEFKCDVALLPELIKELMSALQIAKDDGLITPDVRERLKSGRRSS